MIILLAPVVYLFTQLWTSVAEQAATTTNERAAEAYARPVGTLLTTLVDAQYAAARRADVDRSGIAAAVNNITAIDRRLADPLRIRTPWSRLSNEINSTLQQDVTGPDAVRAYASPIALAQALLGQIADAPAVTRDRGPVSYRLTQVAMRSLPEVIVDIGQLDASAAAPVSGRLNRPPPDPRLAIARDDLVRAADEVGDGLRAGTEPGTHDAVDSRLRVALDQFAAAVDDQNRAANSLGASGIGAANRVLTTGIVLRARAAALQSAVFDALNAHLAADDNGYAARRRALVSAGVIIALAAAALLGLRHSRLADLIAEGAGQAGEPGQQPANRIRWAGTATTNRAAPDAATTNPAAPAAAATAAMAPTLADRFSWFAGGVSGPPDTIAAPDGLAGPQHDGGAALGGHQDTPPTTEPDPGWTSRPAAQSNASAVSLTRRTPGASLAPHLRDAHTVTSGRGRATVAPRDPEAERAAFDGFVSGLAQAQRLTGLGTNRPDDAPDATKEGTR